MDDKSQAEATSSVKRTSQRVMGISPELHGLPATPKKAKVQFVVENNPEAPLGHPTTVAEDDECEKIQRYQKSRTVSNAISTGSIRKRRLLELEAQTAEKL